MKKDYIAISEKLSLAEENTFVENFWTQRWDAITELPKASSIAKREEYQIMQPYLQQLRVGSRILDGGCGMGEWTVFLTNQGFETVGVDISEQTIARLRELLPRYQFVHGDIRHTEFADASFDAYFSWGTFEHLENGQRECVQEAYRILKPGGYLFVSVPFQNWRHLLRDMKAFPQHKGKTPSQQGKNSSMRFYQWRLTGPELERELTIEGFTVLHITPIQAKEGIKRTVHHDFGIQRGSTLHRKMTRLLRHIIPRCWIAHMIMGIAQK